MKIKRLEFIDVLAAVRPGLAKREIIEQATHFIFTGTEVVAYNDYICISHPLKTDFKCTVDADKLYKVLAGIDAEQIDISVDKGEFKISAKKTKSGLSSFKEGKILEYIQGLGLKEKDKKWKKLPEGFIEGLFLCMFSASTDMTHGILTCIYLDGEDMVASDDLRISWYKMAGSIDRKMFIPVQSAVELVKFPVVEYAVTKVEGVTAWIHFRTKEHVMFSTRTIGGDYPSVFSHFEMEGKKLTLPKELQSAVKYVSVLADGAIDIEKKVKVDVEKDSITCTGACAVGWVSRSIPVEYDGRDFSFQINPIFLHEVLGKSVKVLVGKQSAKFTSGKFKHVMVLPS